MISICMMCKTVMGEKEPFEDKTPTHGICIDCMPQWLMDAGLTEAEAMTAVIKMKAKNKEACRE